MGNLGSHLFLYQESYYGSDFKRVTLTWKYVSFKVVFANTT